MSRVTCHASVIIIHHHSFTDVWSPQVSERKQKLIRQLFKNCNDAALNFKEVPTRRQKIGMLKDFSTRHFIEKIPSSCDLKTDFYCVVSFEISCSIICSG